MTRGKQDKLYKSFTKGLITEAGFLTYPEDASTDELNTVIYRKGNRSRRLGIDYEEDSTAVELTDSPPNTSVTTEYFWRSPGHKSSLNFVVVQVANRLYFFDASVSPLSDGQKSFTVNLQNFMAPTSTADQVRDTPVQMAGGKGFLFVAQEYIDPLTIEYNPVTDTINAVRVYILMRDFDGVNDGLPNDFEPSTLSKEHRYNLRNQGWVTPGSPSVQTSIPGGEPGGTGNPPVGGGDDGGTGGASGGGGTYVNPWTGTEHHVSGDGFVGSDLP